MGKKAYFVSDLHLGTKLQPFPSESEKLFRSFLKEISNSASHLFLLGDIFEFWMEYRYYIPKEYFNVLYRLKKLSEKKIEIHYLSGNHDFNLGTFFNKEFGIHTHHHPLKINLQNKNLLLLHGDGMAVSDRKYRVLKKIIVHPVSNFLFKLIHPDWGMSLAKLTGSVSRKHMFNNQVHEYQEKSREILSGDIDILIHGHTHNACVKNFENGIYIDSGNWMDSANYIEMENGVCSLKKYSPDP